MAVCRWKSKMDLRSCFWQVGMTERAKDLTAFTIPSGRCFRWNFMPFGLQGAPGIFQEMMEKVCSETKSLTLVASISKDGFLGAFFDDSGLGKKSVEEHLLVLEEFFKVVQKHNLRIKLSKCDFLQERLDYLVFDIEWRN